MKNIYGLANAMRTVEMACENGEITIIGGGAKPTAVELYQKCVEFINREYGVDILNLVVENKKPCECACHYDAPEEEEEEEIIFLVDKAVAYLEDALPKLMPYADEDCIAEVIEDIADYCEEQNENDAVGDLCNNDIIRVIADLLADKFWGVSSETTEKVAEEVGRYIGNACVTL